jgi:AICAR transformylase/IMP cyclohydrolase PurH
MPLFLVNDVMVIGITAGQCNKIESIYCLYRANGICMEIKEAGESKCSSDPFLFRWSFDLFYFTAGSHRNRIDNLS